MQKVNEKRTLESQYLGTTFPSFPGASEYEWIPEHCLQKRFCSHQSESCTQQQIALLLLLQGQSPDLDALLSVLSHKRPAQAAATHQYRYQNLALQEAADGRQIKTALVNLHEHST